MSSFDLREFRYNLRCGPDRQPQAWRSRFSSPHPLLAHPSAISALAADLGSLFGVGQSPTYAGVDELALLSSIAEARRNSLDVAKQRNAEDSPSGIARQYRLGLIG